MDEDEYRTGTGIGDALDTCAHCGSDLDTGEWHPVQQTRNEDGELRVHSFCGDDCLSAWSDDRDTE